jgi:hypothetical protein
VEGEPAKGRQRRRSEGLRHESKVIPPKAEPARRQRKMRILALEHFRNWCRPKPHTQVAFSGRGPHGQVFVRGAEVKATFNALKRTTFIPKML